MLIMISPLVAKDGVDVGVEEAATSITCSTLRMLSRESFVDFHTCLTHIFIISLDMVSHVTLKLVNQKFITFRRYAFRKHAVSPLMKFI